jgi:hypothetical protein
VGGKGGKAEILPEKNPIYAENDKKQGLWGF